MTAGLACWSVIKSGVLKKEEIFEGREDIPALITLK